MPKTDSGVEEFEVKDDGVESTAKVEDETTASGADEDTTATGETDQTTDDTGDSDATEEESSEEQKFEKRYTQLKGETPEEYARSLEAAYKNSSGEAINLKEANRKLEQRIAELEKGGKEETTTGDPALAYAQSEMERQRREDWDSWLDTHPDVESDSVLRDQVLDEIETQANAIYARTKLIPRMSEVLKRVGKVLDLDDNTEETVAGAAKNVAGQPKGGGAAPKKPDTKGIPEKAYEIGKKMGLSKEAIEKAYKG